MAVDNASDDSLLSKPTEKTQYESHDRSNAIYNPLSTFTLPRSEAKHYQQQYADMYFTRLAQLKPAVEAIASEAFSDFQIGGEQARKVDRVLDVRQGHLCWVIGTVYIEMPLKPNVLEDIGKEHWIAAPPLTLFCFSARQPNVRITSCALPSGVANDTDYRSAK